MIYRRSWHHTTISDCPHSVSESRYVPPPRSAIAAGVFIWRHIRTSPQRYCLRVKSSLLRRNVSAILSSLSPLKRSPFDDTICTALRCCHWKFLILYIIEISQDIFLNFELFSQCKFAILHYVKYYIKVLDFISDFFNIWLLEF